MKKLYFNATKEQRNALEGLAYRIADTAYMRERYGNREVIYFDDSTAALSD